MALETHFDRTFVATLALREKQIQQNYRPVIGVHKWFARRPGTLFRSLLLAEFNQDEPLRSGFYHAHHMQGLIADPFMGGGTTLLEANRLGLHVIGADINPMAYWIVRQELEPLDDQAFVTAAERVATSVEQQLRHLYTTDCTHCRQTVDVKYFIWVKIQDCPSCAISNDLFPGYLLAENSRHPKHVLVCSCCGALVECETLPTKSMPASCPQCSGRVQVEGPARRNQTTCCRCHEPFRYPDPSVGPPKHRLWALEYHCPHCKARHVGRFFKSPDTSDLRRLDEALATFSDAVDLSVPDDAIPEGDETTRLHRWGYRDWRDLFSTRQLLGLGLLQRHIQQVQETPIRQALLTVFSDILRYQNMLCRYDTYALKCQDIFSVHGFPVGLVQCENNILGIPGVGSGGFRHFVEKYRRAKAYCRAPFEARQRGTGKVLVPIAGERIAADIVTSTPQGNCPQAQLICGPADSLRLAPDSLDGVFTDPPYFANVQYAELMDFCYVWLRQSLRSDFPMFTLPTTRSSEEASGNISDGRGIEHFTQALSMVFTRYAAALKPGAPFVFTYHHNDITAYAPLVVAMLDAHLYCTTVLPAPAEMEASLHINNTGSSTLDSVFVARRDRFAIHPLPTRSELEGLFLADCRQMAAGGVRMTKGDAQCLMSGHLARLCVQHLYMGWDTTRTPAERLQTVQSALLTLSVKYEARPLAVSGVYTVQKAVPEQLALFEEESPYDSAVAPAV